MVTKKLTKFYGKSRGVVDLNLEVNKGEIFGFLGPNGVGKTTTIRLLLNLIHPNRGQAEVFGLDSQRNSLEIRSRLGYLPGDVVLYDGMTGDEYLRLMGSFHKGKNGLRLGEISDLLELDLSRQTRAYSKGMKQKLAIIQAFTNDSELLVLDEPTLGLDPLVQHKFYDLLISEKARGKTIFLSSHILLEVERVCDRVGIVRDGQLVSIENVSDLKFKKVRRMEISLSHEIPSEEFKIEGVEIIAVKGTKIQLKVISGNIKNILTQLSKLPIEDMAFPEATLEDTFMEFYGEDKQ
ncbi:MAG: ABC transporter ATP-binding protein [Chloroflexota bacterium]